MISLSLLLLVFVISYLWNPSQLVGRHRRGGLVTAKAGLLLGSRGGPGLRWFSPQAFDAWPGPFRAGSIQRPDGLTGDGWVLGGDFCANVSPCIISLPRYQSFACRADANFSYLDHFR